MTNEEIVTNFIRDNIILLLIGSIVLVEVIYLILIRTYKKTKEESLGEFSLKNKVLSIFYSTMLIVTVIVLVTDYYELLFLLGLVGAIVLFFYVNYLVAKVFSKEESEAERKAREIKEEEKYGYKFKVGDKVKIISRNQNNSNHMRYKVGDIAKIRRRYTNCERNCYRLEGFKGSWLEHRLQKVRK